MADFTAGHAWPDAETAPDGKVQQGVSSSPVQFGGGGAPSAVDYFKMRALADPGPGYEVWVATGAPDYTGAGAEGPIQGGTAVVVAEWTEP